MTTRKHFEAVAKVIKARLDLSYGPEYSAVEKLAEDLTKVYEQENPRFDRERFLKACGL